MSEKALLHAENYTVETVERTTSDAETGQNPQQEQADGLKISGLALPFKKRSRNGVIYEQESVEQAAETLIGCSILFNHDENQPIGHVKDVEVTDEGLKYEGDLNPELRETDSLERGDIPNVSIQAMIEETESETADVAITEFLELSAVTVPGFPSAGVETEGIAIESFVDRENSVEEADTGQEQDERSFEFVPIPDLVLYRSEDDARERANDLGIEGIHVHELDNEQFYMAGETHGQWRQLVGKPDAESREDTGKEPFAGFDDWDDCMDTMQNERGHDEETARKICGALKDKEEILSGGKSNMTDDNTEEQEQVSEQFEEVAEDDFIGTVADMYEELSASDAGSLFGDFEFTGDPMPLVAQVADLADMTPADLVELVENEEEVEADDVDDDEEDDEEPENDEGTHSDDEDDMEDDESADESSNLNQGSQTGNDMNTSSKPKEDMSVEELENRIQELEETIARIEGTEPSKQEPANKAETRNGFNVRSDAQDKLTRR